MKADGKEPVEREDECSRERERNRPKIARVRLSCVEKGAQGWDGRTDPRGRERGEHLLQCPKTLDGPHQSREEGHFRVSVNRTLRSNQSTLKEINPEYSLEGLMLKLKLQ